MTFSNDELSICTDDLRVDMLATELVGLKPIWATANKDYVRSCEILKELDDLNPSRCQKQQIITFVRLQWRDASLKAQTMGLFNKSATTDPIYDQLAGICFIKATSQNHDALELNID